MATDKPDDRKLLSEILSAFVRNPEMLDSLEGIARWRLLSTRIRSDVEGTKEALDTLVATGYLLMVDTAAGPLFQINPEKLGAAKELLQEFSAGARETKIEKSSQETNAVPITITNQTKQLLLVPLASRATLHLAPGETSSPLGDLEVNQNNKVEKLAKLGQIRINRAATKAAGKPGK
ncbi:MAG TPA: hypothetical protein VFL42_03075 [Terriglobales bacterium]|nr:hypothetical protein [Terriglobales bacterium]